MERLSAGQICMANSDHDSTKPNELRFCKGDLILILSDGMEDELHYLASTADGNIGQFPSSAIKKRSPISMLPMPWFHSTISRLEAEKLLDRNQNGQFIFRTSQNTKGVYALAISYKGEVKHYLIAMDFKNRRVTLDGEKYFDNLPALVQFYKRPTPHLCSPLVLPVVRRSALEYFVDQEELKKNWGIPVSELVTVDETETLGHGEFGEVRIGTYRGTQVAIKYIHDSKQSAAAVSSFLREATIFTHLRHKNLVQLVGVVFQGSTIQSIVMELMGKGSLQKYLISRGRSVISQGELLSFAKDVCEGMVYVSSKGYVHRDLAARNVLLNSNGQAKISDFGLARKEEIHVPHEGGKFPVKWTAPEALKESKFTIKSDVWSFGVFLWEAYSYGRTPYPSVPAEEVLETLEDGIVMDPPDTCPDQMYSIMCRCWKMEPGDRPSFPTLLQVLSKSLGDSHTPFGSPVPVRKMTAMPEFKVDDLVMSPVADKSYQDAPLQRKITMFLGNIVFLGRQGSGKTSLLRSLGGEVFRLMEPFSHLITMDEGYHEIRDTLSWSRSTAGLVYEDELVRIIVEDLLKHALSAPSASNGRGFSATMTPPPLPPRRVHSFSEAHTRSTSHFSDLATKASNRLSGSYEVMESNTPEGKLQLGYRPQPVADNDGGRSPKMGLSRNNRKNLIGKFLSSSFRAKSGKASDLRRSYSDSAHREHQVVHEDSNGLSHTPPSSPRPYQSSIPEQLIDKIKSELRESSGGTLPAKYFGKLIDTPGHVAFQPLKPLFITENSLCVLTFDASKDIMTVPSPSLQRKGVVKEQTSQQNGTNGLSSHSNMPSYYQPSGSKHSKLSFLGQIMKEIGDVCLQWSHCNADMSMGGARIVLVGTHSDKVPSTISHRNFELLQDAIKSSPYKKYVALLKFIVSNSSIIERSSTDDLKHFIMELVKKACRQQVPLKWLRCVRRFQGMPRKGVYFLSLAEARQIIKQICDIQSDEEEVSRVIHFLHRNQVIQHFDRIHHLKELVITDPAWFASQISHIFSASFVDLKAEGAPAELTSDQELLRSKGVLTHQLLSFVWREKSIRVKQEELLTIMSKMDLLCCMASDTQPLPPIASVEDLTKDVSSKSYKSRNSVVSSVIIPSLVEERKPSHLATLPSFNIEPIIFRFKTDHIPSGLFSRLVVRCVQSYPRDYSIYKNGATFEVDPTSLLMLSLDSDHIKVSLHRIRSACVTESLPSSMDVTDLDSLLNDPNTPNPDTCLAILMFVRATLSDLVQQWMPHLDFDLCVLCECSAAHSEEEVFDSPDAPEEDGLLSRKVSACSTTSCRSKSPGDKHFVVLNDVDSLSQSSVKCELGTAVPSSASLSCWFGEVPSDYISATSPTDDLDFVTDSDLKLVVKVLGKSWAELGQTLGYTKRELERFSLSSHSLAQAGERMLEEWQTLHPRNATFFGLLGALEIVQRRDIADELVAARMAAGGISL